MNPQDHVAAHLASYIENQALPPQSKLPPERRLCEELKISRGELRKALSLLEAEGKIWRHVGRGTFIGTRPLDRMDEITALSTHTNPAEVMQARLLLEPGLARIAAIQSTAADIERMRLCSKRKDAAVDWHTYERWDGAFHQAVAKGAHNMLLLTLFNALNTVREATEWGRLRKSRLTDAHRQRSGKQHLAIIDAIIARDMEQAETAMRDHLHSVHKALLGSNYEADEVVAIDDAIETG
ncbi:MAG: FadR family transcriptional regulator [Rhodospirillaceae bacterium]|nr:FadR family transcriptional regulator [Rhodospirillaceae bacterium]MBL6941873.1 FadR family transcriptional regulator [Rhodospirillales bacterium]